LILSKIKKPTKTKVFKNRQLKNCNYKKTTVAIFYNYRKLVYC